MRTSSQFQTSGLLLLTATIIMGGLVSAMLFPMLKPQRAQRSLPFERLSEAETLAAISQSQKFLEFYPSPLQLTGYTPATALPGNVECPPDEAIATAEQAPVAASWWREDSDGQQTVTSPASIVTGLESCSAASCEHSRRDDEAVPVYLRASAPAVPNQEPKVQQGNASDFAYSAGVLSVDTQQTQRQATSAAPLNSVPDRSVIGGVYAPVTVHPVTVNIDGAAFAEQIKNLEERLEATLLAREMAVKKSRRSNRPRNSRDNQDAQPPELSEPHTDKAEVAELENELQRLTDSFNALKSETDARLQQLSTEADRAAVAQQVIESYRRALERAEQQDRTTGSARVAIRPATVETSAVQPQISEMKATTVPPPTATIEVGPEKIQQQQPAEAHPKPEPNVVPIPFPTFNIPNESAETEDTHPDRGVDLPQASLRHLPVPDAQTMTTPNRAADPMPFLPQAISEDLWGDAKPPQTPARNHRAVFNNSVVTLGGHTAAHTPQRNVRLNNGMGRPKDFDAAPERELQPPVIVPVEWEEPQPEQFALQPVPPQPVPPQPVPPQPVPPQPAVERIAPVGFEHVYRFKLAEVQDELKVVPADGQVCQECGKVHPASTSPHRPAQSAVSTDSAQPSPKSHLAENSASPARQNRRPVVTRHGARGTNRHLQAAAGDQQKSSAVPALSVPDLTTEENEAGVLHRISSTIRHLGNSRIE